MDVEGIVIRSGTAKFRLFYLLGADYENETKPILELVTSMLHMITCRLSKIQRIEQSLIDENSYVSKVEDIAALLGVDVNTMKTCGRTSVSEQG